MPANLTPMYLKAEQEFRRAETAQERVTCLMEMLRLIPKHKGTDHLQADLKRKLKETKAEAEVEKKAPKKGVSYRFPRQGAGTVIVLGPPNSGKSRIVGELTNASVEIADYPYSTREPVPGIMERDDVRVQLVDTPPVSSTHLEPYIVNMTRSADACLLIFNGSSDDAPDEIAETVQQLSSRKIRFASETGFAEDDFSIVNVRTLMVVTHADDVDCDMRLEFLHELHPEIAALPRHTVNCEEESSVEQLREAIYQLLGVMRIYTKRPGKPAEYVDPFTIPIGGNVEDLAYRVHNEIGEGLKFAKVWGSEVTDGQTVGRDHVLVEGDMVELHT